MEPEVDQAYRRRCEARAAAARRPDVLALQAEIVRVRDVRDAHDDAADAAYQAALDAYRLRRDPDEEAARAELAAFERAIAAERARRRAEGD